MRLSKRRGWCHSGGGPLGATRHARCAGSVMRVGGETGRGADKIIGGCRAGVAADAVQWEGAGPGGRAVGPPLQISPCSGADWLVMAAGQVSLPTQYNGKEQDPVGALSGHHCRYPMQWC